MGGMQTTRVDDFGGGSTTGMEAVQQAGHDIPGLLDRIDSLCDWAKREDDREISEAEKEIREQNTQVPLECEEAKPEIERFKNDYNNIWNDCVAQRQRLRRTWDTYFSKHLNVPSNLQKLASSWGESYAKSWGEVVTDLEQRQRNHDWQGKAANLYHAQVSGQQQGAEEMAAYAKTMGSGINSVAKIHAAIYLDAKGFTQTTIGAIEEMNNQGPVKNKYGRRINRARNSCRWLADQLDKLAGNEAAWRPSIGEVNGYTDGMDKDSKAFTKGHWPKATEDVQRGKVDTGDPSKVQAQKQSEGAGIDKVDGNLDSRDYKE